MCPIETRERERRRVRAIEKRVREKWEREEPSAVCSFCRRCKKLLSWVELIFAPSPVLFSRHKSQRCSTYIEIPAAAAAAAVAAVVAVGRAACQHLGRGERSPAQCV